MVKSNQDIIGEQCIKDDYDALTVNDEDKKVNWKSYKKLFGTAFFAWYKNSLDANNISSPQHFSYFL